jgi:DNA primase catalytic core
MLFSADFINRVKSSIDIVDLVGRDIPLHKKGNSYRGTVWKAGKSGESLVVTPDKQLWRNTKGKEGGDVFDWIAVQYGLDRDLNFTEIIKIAADFAGILLEGLSEEDKKAIAEENEVKKVLEEAVNIYHYNLLKDPEIIGEVKNNWNFEIEDIKEFKIGYATGHDLKELDKNVLAKAGLLFLKDGKPVGEFYRKRIIIPYIKNEKVIYLIGRRTEREKFNSKGAVKPKYVKLQAGTNSPYVSKAISNQFFYGEDSIKGANYIVITEGITDAISAIKNGYPTLSAVTTHLKKDTIQRFVKLARNRPIYICLDIDKETKAGQEGAIDTARELVKQGLDVYIITLDDADGKIDYDLNDFFKKHQKADFDKYVEDAPSFAKHILNLSKPKNSESIEKKMKIFCKLINDDLSYMSSILWLPFVEEEVIPAFGLKKSHVREAITQAEKARDQASKVVPAEQDVDQQAEPTNDFLSTYPENIIDMANDISNNGDSFDFILGVWNRLHVGDINIGENLLSSIWCTQVINAKLGAHQKPSGGSGKGKSSAFQNMIHLLPAHKCIVGSMSSKALFYDPNLKPGTITYTDDVQFSPEVVGMMKQATSDFQAETKHRTVNADRKFEEFSIPSRVTFWLSSVDSIQDDQLATRFYFGQVDESQEQDERVYEKQKERMKHSTCLEKDLDVLTCRCIFEILFQNVYDVAAPYIDAVSWNDKEHRRNHDKFLDMLAGVTVYNFRQRDIINGMLVSTLDDYDRAIQIYSGTAKSNALCLNEDEQAILWGLSSGQELTSKELYTKAKGYGYNKAERTMTRTIKGEKGSTGMLTKVNDLNQWIDREIMSIETKNGKIKTVSRDVQKYQYTGDIFKHLPESNHVKFDCILFQTVASIDREKAQRLDKEWRENGGQCSLISEDTEDIRRHQKTNNNDVCINDCSISDNNIVYINKDIKRQEITDNVREQNSTQNLEYPPAIVNNEQKKDGKNIFFLANGKNVSSDEIQGKMCQQIAESRIQTDCLLMSSDVFSTPNLSSDAIVTICEQKPTYSTGVASQLRSELNRLANSLEYNGIVEDIDAFVKIFNERTPEYKIKFGQWAVLCNAEKQKDRGWK